MIVEHVKIFPGRAHAYALMLAACFERDYERTLSPRALLHRLARDARVLLQDTYAPATLTSITFVPFLEGPRLPRASTLRALAAITQMPLVWWTRAFVPPSPPLSSGPPSQEGTPWEEEFVEQVGPARAWEIVLWLEAHHALIRRGQVTVMRACDGEYIEVY